jgi:hypothetical protein
MAKDLSRTLAVLEPLGKQCLAEVEGSDKWKITPVMRRYYIKMGAILNEAKHAPDRPHRKGWISAWYQEVFQISRSTANRYMREAEQKDKPESETVHPAVGKDRR